MNKSKGVFFVILSAVSFGIMPILAVYAYKGNCNAFTLTFLRSLFAIPMLGVILKFNKNDFRISKSDIAPLFLLAILGGVSTTLLLFQSYKYISVGMATTLHFIYPVIVTLVCILLYHEKVVKSKIMALILSTLGVLLFFNNNSSVNYTGVIIALLSGCTYAYYIIYLDKSNLNDMSPFKLTFYLSIICAIVILIFGYMNHQISFNITRSAWIFSFAVSFITQIVAVVSFQIGLKDIGPSSSAILSTFEPITSIILGFIIFKEMLTTKSIIGCIFILISVVLLSKKSKEEISQ